MVRAAQKLRRGGEALTRWGGEGHTPRRDNSSREGKAHLATACLNGAWLTALRPHLGAQA